MVVSGGVSFASLRAAMGGCAMVLMVTAGAPARADLDGALQRLETGDITSALPELRALARDGEDAPRTRWPDSISMASASIGT